MKTINIDLNEKNGIKAAKSELRQYRKKIVTKTRSFVSRLITVGIKTARMNTGKYGEVIAFERDIHQKDNAIIGKLIAVGQPIYGMRKNELVEANPVLLAEFGSGWEAKVLDKPAGLNVGQGTFPGQTHAFNPQGWYYVSLEDGETYHTYGERPTFPMHAAMTAMLFDIDRIAKEVFGNG